MDTAFEKAQADEAKAPQRALAVRGRDLLLVLALGFGSTFLLGLLVPWPLRSVWVVLLFLVLQSAVLLAAVYLAVVRRRGVGWAALGFQPAARSWVVGAAGLALLVILVTGLLNLTMQELAGEPLRNPQLQLLAPYGFSWSGLIGVLLVTGLVVPIAEETTFRGLLYGWLRRRWNVPASALGSAFAFSVLHGIPVLIPAIAVLGVVLALVYERSGSLWPSIVLHGTFNAAMALGLYLALALGVPLE
ncbi:MAG: type II CAAX endopeptidase family protein [Dongiaceae bacterium]